MAQEIRILHVITRMVRGGAQENTLATVRGIHGLGWESCLVTGPALGPEGSLEPECEAAGVRLLRVPELVREPSPKNDAAALASLVRIMRKERPHLVHTHTSKAGILGRVAARIARVPVVIHTPHGHVFHSYESRFKSRVFIHAERWVAPLARRLIALTDTERREHLELGVGKPESWRVVHSGIDFAPFLNAATQRDAVRQAWGVGPGEMVIGTVGRLVPIKGQTYLIDAFARLAAERRGLHLVLIGDGELSDSLRSQAHRAGLKVSGEENDTGKHGTVHFTGLRRDIPRLLAGFDIFALPSLNEGMGRVLVEAMAMELPCVASRVSGIPDVVEEGVTGLLVEARDTESLAAALRKVAASPLIAREMGRAGKKKVIPAFGCAEMIRKIEELYREALLEKGIIPPAKDSRLGKAT